MVFINGDWVPEEKATLHIADLSIQRGYGVFDFFKVVNSVPVFLDEHLDRFYFSAGQMRLEIGYSKEELKTIVLELLRKNAAHNTGVRITLTGGYSEDGFQLTKPNLVITLRQFTPPSKEQFNRGIKLLSYEYQRQLPHVKSIDYLMAIWLQPFVKQNGADDALYHQGGIVSECPRSNFFIINKENKIITPSKNTLKGVIRTKLIELVKNDFDVEERDLSIRDIKSAKEAFITSTTKTLLPVSQVDDYVFTRNQITSQLYHSFVNVYSLQNV